MRDCKQISPEMFGLIYYLFFFFKTEFFGVFFFPSVRHFVSDKMEPNCGCIKRDYVRLVECEWLIKRADDRRIHSWKGC